MDRKEQAEKSEQEILLLLAENPDTNFSYVVIHFEPLLRPYARRLLQSEAEGDDAFQDAMFHASMNLKHASIERIMSLKLKAWLYAIITNECKGRFKKRRFEATFENWEDQLLRADPSEEPETAFERLEIRDALMAAIGRLPVIYQEVLILRYIFDLKGKDIAQQLDRPLNTIKAQIRRGIRVLRKLLADELEMQPPGELKIPIEEES